MDMLEVRRLRRYNEYSIYVSFKLHCAIGKVHPKDWWMEKWGGGFGWRYTNDAMKQNVMTIEYLFIHVEGSFTKMTQLYVTQSFSLKSLDKFNVYSSLPSQKFTNKQNYHSSP